MTSLAFSHTWSCDVIVRVFAENCGSWCWSRGHRLETKGIYFQWNSTLLKVFQSIKEPVVNLIKHFTIVIYDFRVILTRNFPYYNSRVVIYTRKIFIRLATDWLHFVKVNLKRANSIYYIVLKTKDSPKRQSSKMSTESIIRWNNALRLV